jgi:predicted nucleotidyltransferase
MSNLNDIKAQLIPILRQHGVVFAAIFGSFAKKKERPDSDLDLLVRFNENKSFFELYNLEQQIETLIGHKIDLVSEKAIKKELLPYIKAQMQVLL